MARLEELTHELEALERYSRQAGVGQFLLSLPAAAVMLAPIFASVGRSIRIAPDGRPFPERFVETLVKPILETLPLALAVILIIAFFGDLLIAALLKGYEIALRNLEEAHPQAALEAYGRIFTGKWWAGTHLVRNRLGMRAARHAARHPELLHELSDDELNGLAGQWAYRAGTAVREPDDQPLPILDLAAQELIARGRTTSELVIKSRSYMNEMRVPQLLPNLETDPEERLTQVRPPLRVDVIFHVSFWGLLAAAIFFLVRGQASFGLIGLGIWIAYLIGYLFLAKRVTGNYPPYEHLFQAWRLRETNPGRFLELTFFQPDAPLRFGRKGTAEEWAVKAIARHPGLAEVLRDEDMQKLGKIVKAMKPSRSLPADVLEKAKPLVGVG